MTLESCLWPGRSASLLRAPTIAPTVALKVAPTVASLTWMRSCSAHNDYRGVWIVAERRWWFMTTESALRHSEKYNWAGTHKTRADDVQKKSQQCDITGQSSSPQSTRMYREKTEYTERFVQNKISSVHKSFLDLLSKKDKMRLCLTTNDMYLSWICWHDPLQFYAKMGHLSREETIISKWLSALRGMTCLGRMSL